MECRDRRKVPTAPIDFGSVTTVLPRSGCQHEVSRNRIRQALSRDESCLNKQMMDPRPSKERNKKSLFRRALFGPRIGGVEVMAARLLPHLRDRGYGYTVYV